MGENKKVVNENLNSLKNFEKDKSFSNVEMENRVIGSVRDKVLKTIGIAIVLIVVLLVILNFLLNNLFLNPQKMNSEPDYEFLKVMRTYVDVNYPFREVVSLNVDKKCFGRFGIKMQIADRSKEIYIGKENVFSDYSFEKFKNIMDPNSLLMNKVNRFINEEDKNNLIKKIQQLPESANVYLSVSDKDIRSIDELRKLIKNIDWIQVYQPDAGFQGGISINQVALFNDTDKRKDMGEDEILKTYQNNLQLLADNTRIWGQFDLSDGLSKVYQPNQIKETLKETKKLKRLKIKNYSVFGTKEEIINYLNQVDLDSIIIENVTLY